MDLSEEEWKNRLSPEQYKVLRQKGTEKAFSGEYYNCKKNGIYHCAGCNQKLFFSKDKFDSKTGWPSFTQPFNFDAVEFDEDNELSHTRIEVLCSNCHGHLGHVFEDGPPPTHKRYCINSIALKLEEAS